MSRKLLVLAVAVAASVWLASSSAMTPDRIQPIRPYPVSEHGTKLLVNKGHRLVPLPHIKERGNLAPRPVSEH